MFSSVSKSVYTLQPVVQPVVQCKHRVSLWDRSDAVDRWHWARCWRITSRELILLANCFNFNSWCIFLPLSGSFAGIWIARILSQSNDWVNAWLLFTRSSSIKRREKNARRDISYVVYSSIPVITLTNNHITVLGYWTKPRRAVLMRKRLLERHVHSTWTKLNCSSEHVYSRVVHGSILFDPIQPNPWVNPTHKQLWCIPMEVFTAHKLTEHQPS